MPTNDYMPIATSPTANVESQADFANSGHQQSGFSSGILFSRRVNKCWRQASLVGSAIAQFIVNMLNVDVLDDGNRDAFVTNFTEAIRAAAGLVVVPAFFHLTGVPGLDFPHSGYPTVVYDVSLAGNVPSSSMAAALTPGQVMVFMIHQDGVGGRSFVWPSNIPGDTIDSTANVTSVQQFVADAAGVAHPLGPMTVS